MFPFPRETNIAYRDYSFSLAAGETKTFSVRGDYWQVVTSTSPITLAFDNGSSITRGQGTGGPQNYSRVEITSAVAQTVTISLGQTNGLVPYDSRGSLVGTTVNVTVKEPNTITSQADAAIPVTSQLMLTAADSTTMTTIIALPSTAAGPIRIGDNTTNGSTGAMLEPGGTLTIDGTMAIYAYNPNASAVTPTITRTRFV